MAPYRLIFRDEARADLRKLDHSTLRRIIDKLEWLAENIDRVRTITLGYDLNDLYKLRIGQW